MPADTAIQTRSTRKPKGEGHERRAEILSAAERIFIAHGYEGATIRKIADEVGLSSTALYMHFPDKGEILLEICRNAFAALRVGHAEIMAQPVPPEVRARRLLDAYIAFGFANPNAYRLIYMTRPDEAKQAQAAAEELGADLFHDFEAVIEEAAAQGRLKVGAREAAQTLWAGAHGVVSLMITKPYFDWAGQAVLTRTMLDGLLGGLLRP